MSYENIRRMAIQKTRDQLAMFQEKQAEDQAEAAKKDRPQGRQLFEEIRATTDPTEYSRLFQEFVATYGPEEFERLDALDIQRKMRGE